MLHDKDKLRFWQQKMPELTYRILFEEGTEPAGSSHLNAESRHGVYVCAACKQPLFTSEQKFDSGTGWPSFSNLLPGAIHERIEYHCSDCGGHQGHMFRDGPEPSGLRYCNNGISLEFVPDAD